MENNLPTRIKAWELDWSNIDGQYEYDRQTMYAETAGKVKQEFLKYYSGISCYITGDELTFLTIKVRRNKHEDLILHDVEQALKHKNVIRAGYKTKYQIEAIEQEIKLQKEQQELLENNDWFHIRKGGSYYRDNSCGYTDNRSEAGIYNRQEASRAIGHGVTARAINVVEHNKYINDKIEYLKTKLIEF